MKLPPRVSIALRRACVTFGVVASLVLGAVTVRAAAAWTASAAPMDAPPISASEIYGRLADASIRSAALEQQIVDLTTRTADLATALAATTERVGTDTTTARTLRKQLAAAQKKLAALTRALNSPTPAQEGSAPTPTPAPTHHEDDD